MTVSPRIASDRSGNTTPQNTVKAMATSSRLLYRNAASRETRDSSRERARSNGSRATMSTAEKTTTTTMKPTNHAPIGDCEKLWIELTTPLRVRKVPKIESAKVIATRTTFQMRSMPFFSCTMTEWR